MPPVGLALPEERAGSIFGNGNGIHNLDQAAVKPTAENVEEPTVICLDVLVKSARVVSVEHVCAHIAWSKPEYADDAPHRPDLPEIKCIRFEVDWAEVTGPQQVLKEGDWQPLPSGDVEACEVKVAGLRPGRTYGVRIRPVVETDDVGDAVELRPQPSRPVIFSTAPTVPSQVKPPLLVSRERKALKVKWNVPDELGGAAMSLSYQLFMSPAPQEWPGVPDAQGYVEVYRGEERAFKVLKLVPGARYNFWVLAWNSVGCSEVGQVGSYTTQATVPGQPDPPRPVASTQATITLAWTPPAPNGSPVTTYQLERDEGGALATQSGPPAAGTTYMLAYAGPSTTCTVNGLRSGVHYRFRVRAQNGEGLSYWSECCLATTAASAPGPPTAISISSATRDSATLMWGLPPETGGAAVHAHEVELQAVSRAAIECMGPDWYAIFRGAERGCSINSLRPGCTYRVRIRSANSAGWGSWALPVECSTAADVPEAPGPPSIAEAGTASLGLQWHPPLHNGGAKISGYRLEMAVGAGTHYDAAAPPTGVLSDAVAIRGVPPGSPVFTVYRGEEPLARVGGLAPGGVYAFRVAAANAQGVGPWSDWGVLGTSADTPLPPPPPALVAPPTANGLALAWGVPHGRGSDVSGYVVQVAAGGYVTSSEEVVGAPGHDQAPNQPQQPAEGMPEGGSAVVAAPVLRWQQVYRGSAAGCELAHLAPSNRYLVRVAAANAVGPGEWSEAAVFTTAPAPPAPPSSVAVEAAGARELLVHWTPPPADNGAAVSGYAVDCAPLPPPVPLVVASLKGGAAAATQPPAPQWSQVVATGPGECAARVAHLAPGRQYVVRVRALNAAGSSGATPAPTPVATLPAPPAAPQRLSLGQRTATAARLKWDPPAEENGAAVTEYRLEVALQLGPAGSTGSTADWDAAGPAAGFGTVGSVPGVWVLVYSGPDTEARVPDLLPAATYLARVSAANAAGYGPCGLPLSFTTALAPPGPPTGLRAWVVGMEEPQAQVPLVAVAAGNAGAAADCTPSAAGPSTPQLSGPPVVGLAWCAPAPSPGCAPSATYEVHAAPVPAAPKLELRVNVGKGCDAKLDRLLPGTRYELRVRAVGAEGAGHGAWSEKVELSTPAAPAGASASGAVEGAGAGSAAGQDGVQAEGGAKRRKGAAKKGAAAVAAARASAATGASSSAAESDDGLQGAGAVSSTRGGAAAAPAVPTGRKVNTSKLTMASAHKKPPPPPDTIAGKLYLVKKYVRTQWRAHKLYVLVVLGIAALVVMFMWLLRHVQNSHNTNPYVKQL